MSRSKPPSVQRVWLGIHITYLIGFANRLVVLTRWAWTFSRTPGAPA